MSDGCSIFSQVPQWPSPALFMNASAAIADPLLRQACGRRAHPSVLRRTARVRLRTSGLRAPRAALATRLRDFATNRHE